MHETAQRTLLSRLVHQDARSSSQGIGFAFFLELHHHDTITLFDSYLVVNSHPLKHTKVLPYSNSSDKKGIH
jgi:hypothetical protein